MKGVLRKRVANGQTVGQYNLKLVFLNDLISYSNAAGLFKIDDKEF